MKTKMTAYWPPLVVTVLVALAALESYGTGKRHAPLPAAEVSSELARAMSYGLVGGEAQRVRAASPATAPTELPRAS